MLVNSTGEMTTKKRENLNCDVIFISARFDWTLGNLIIRN